MIHLLPYGLLLVNHIVLSFAGVVGIFFLMRAYSLWCTPERKINFHSLSYLFFVPELITGPHRDFEQWQRLRFDWQGLNLDFFIKVSAFLCLIFASGIAFKEVLDFSDHYIIRALAAYLCLFAQFYAASKIVNEVSVIFGQKPILNFNDPFYATSVANFWERWHISLGNFAKRYIAQPINFALRKKKMRMNNAYMLTTLATFLFIGIWHHLSLAYACFGLYFSGIIIVERLFLHAHIEKLKSKKFGPLMLMIYTQGAHFIGFLFVAEKISSILIKAG